MKFQEVSLITMSAVAAQGFSRLPALEINSFPLTAAIVLVGYAVTLALSGPVVTAVTALAQQPTANETDSDPSRFRTGAIIGKCENLLALTLILAGEVTSLSIIFAAKSLVRGDAMSRNPGYYLAGTLVNITWSVSMGFLLRLALAMT